MTTIAKHKASGCTKARREPSRYLCAIDPRADPRVMFGLVMVRSAKKRIVSRLTNYVIHYGKLEILNKCRKT